MNASEIDVLIRNAFESQDEPVGLSDDELLDLVYAGCEELRRRRPRYAFEQGDLEGPDQYEQMESAEHAVQCVARMRAAFGVPRVEA